MDRATRRVQDSRTEFSKIVLSADVNGTGSLFGGRLMEWIDVVAAVVARRHSGSDVVTASVDSLRFQAPAKLNDIVVLHGRLVYVGRTSMLVCVDTYVEDSECHMVTHALVNRAYLTMVALGADHKPQPVPRLLLQTDQEREDFTLGKARRDAALPARQG